MNVVYSILTNMEITKHLYASSSLNLVVITYQYPIYRPSPIKDRSQTLINLPKSRRFGHSLHLGTEVLAAWGVSDRIRRGASETLIELTRTYRSPHFVFLFSLSTGSMSHSSTDHTEDVIREI